MSTNETESRADEIIAHTLAEAALMRSTAVAFDAVLGAMHKPPAAQTIAKAQEIVGRMETANSPTTADLGAMAGEPKEHYAGGPDGPIREPGDDMPSRSDIYSDGELCAQLDRHRSRLAKLGLYDIAADLNHAVDEITDQADTIERLSKTILQLAAEKVVAQNWITNLRATNASYMEQIAEQNAKLAEVGK